MPSRTQRDYLEGSWFVRKARRLWAGVARRAGRAWHRLLGCPAVSEIRRAWVESPLHWGGVITLSGVLSNSLVLWLLGRQVGWGGILLRVLFFLAGLAALSCRGDWDSVRRGSAFLRFLFPRRER